MNINIKWIIVLCAMMSSIIAASGQEYRTIDGSNNNLTRPEWGRAHTPLRTVTPYAFGNGYSTPGGADRGNPRIISNAIFSQNTSITESKAHSDFIWLFGQFLDHDLTLVESDPSQSWPIRVPTCDAVFDPNCTGQSLIPFSRSIQIDGTGTDINNPAGYENALTAYIDGSMVYGSNQEMADWLRSFEDGLLKVSEGQLMPYNTIDGEYDSPVDPNAPAMDIGIPGLNKWYIAGDVRANENTFLAAIHTVFVREHNWWARRLKVEHPAWDDERLYQEARVRTIGVIQSIVYEEWLPALGINIPAYQGYRPDVDPSIMKVFSVAAFRIGHTMLSTEMPRLDANCTSVPEGSLRLRDAFFNLDELQTDEDMDVLLRGLAANAMQEIDGQVIDDVRNLLFGPPEAGMGMDLASINIMRGRDMGLPGFNDVRRALGLPPYQNFIELCSDLVVVDRLEAAYASIEEVDPWVGMLCEIHMGEDIMVGQTIAEILRRQFAAVRDGDRFYYESMTQLTAEEVDEIKNTTMSDVLRRNSGIRLIQDNAFLSDDNCTHDEVVLEERLLDATLYPNPVTNLAETRIGIYATQDIDMLLRVYDVTGRFVYADQMPLFEGMNFYQFNPAVLESGQYIVELNAGAAYQQIKFLYL